MSRQFYTLKCNEAYQRAQVAVKSIFNACMPTPKDDDSESDVAAYLGESIFRGIVEGLSEFYPVDERQPEIYEAIKSLKLDESAKSNRPSLREAQNRVAEITGKRSLKEGAFYEKMISNLADKLAARLGEMDIQFDIENGVDEDTYEQAAQVAQDLLDENDGDPNMFQDLLDELGIFIR